MLISPFVAGLVCLLVPCRRGGRRGRDRGFCTGPQHGSARRLASHGVQGDPCVASRAGRISARRVEVTTAKKEKSK